MAESAGARAETENILQVRTASPRAVLRLKCWQPLARGFAPKLSGLELPLGVGAVSEGVPRVLCTGPGEWLVVHAPPAVARMCAVLAPELEHQTLVLVDLTDGLVALEISGSRAVSILSKSCGIDFNPRRFGENRCVRTCFAQIAVVIDCIRSGETYALYVSRSHAPYSRMWLCDAARGL